MKFNHLYYQLKPYLPRQMRMAVRRIIARKKRRMFSDVWPINEAAALPPRDWPGWPDGKKFALVLTHDIEGREGMEKCRSLMEMEMKLGFRSSFNFIPEGKYAVPSEFRAELRKNGFEVGVHDLHHDGKLYNNRQAFSKKADRINHYLREWDALGFRSGFMMRNLDWLHDIEALYDSSTFDTDPFEPQSDGAGTIFPFWIPNERGGGYAELPYTLPQDSTLFLLLQEDSPKIWLKKLDWVARHGGMALVNVHPDYLQFEGEPSSPSTYCSCYYENFLQQVREKYGESCWYALPKEVAAFTERIRPAPHRKPKRVCMVTYSHYLMDARVKNYAQALAQRGDHVDVLALQKRSDSPVRERCNQVNVVRLQGRFDKNEKTIVAYLFPIIKFFFSCAWWIARNHTRQRYDVFHIHNMPDFLVFTALYPKWTGAKVILDIHDVMPELFASKFRKPDQRWEISMLKTMEKLSSKGADHVIIANDLWNEKYARRTGSNGKCSTFINYVDTDLFQSGLRMRNDDKLLIIFPGSLQWHQGLDIAIRAFVKVRAELPQAEFHIYGKGNMKSSLIALSQELGIDHAVRFFEAVPLSEIAKVMANADLGVVPKRAETFGNEAYSTKILQFMALGVPVVVSNTKIDKHYFNDSVVRFFESDNPDSLAEAMLEVLRNSELRQTMIANASEYAAQNSWQERQEDYLKLVEDLCARKEVATKM